MTHSRFVFLFLFLMAALQAPTLCNSAEPNTVSVGMNFPEAKAILKKNKCEIAECQMEPISSGESARFEFGRIDDETELILQYDERTKKVFHLDLQFISPDYGVTLGCVNRSVKRISFEKDGTASVAIARVQNKSGKPANLSGSSTNEFFAHLGGVVSLEGTLENGKIGMTLSGTDKLGMPFYVKPEIRGGYSYPAEWVKKEGKVVRVTGTLQVELYPKQDAIDSEGRAVSIPISHFFMVLQNTTVELLEPKKPK